MWCAWLRLNLYGCNAVLEIAVSDLKTAFLRKHLQQLVTTSCVTSYFNPRCERSGEKLDATNVFLTRPPVG